MSAEWEKAACILYKFENGRIIFKANAEELGWYFHHSSGAVNDFARFIRSKCVGKTVDEIREMLRNRYGYENEGDEEDVEVVHLWYDGVLSCPERKTEEVANEQD